MVSRRPAPSVSRRRSSEILVSGFLTVRRSWTKTRRSLWAVPTVRARTGVAPEQIVDWLSLIGDSVDNIPGVPGVGPKTATALLQQFGSVDCLYARLSEVSSEKLRASLQAAASIVRRNQELIRLKDDLADVWPIEQTLLNSREPEQLRALYAEWGFRTLLAQLSPAAAQSDLFSG